MLNTHSISITVGTAEVRLEKAKKKTVKKLFHCYEKLLNLSSFENPHERDFAANPSFEV